MKPVILVSAPRSGSTFFASLFDRHPEIASWHEPYFIWQFYSGRRIDDVLTEKDATPAARKFITREFQYFSSRQRKPIILEKTPANAFKIKFINAVFPDAKWIHLFRDGRAVIGSLKNRYRRRDEATTSARLFNLLNDIWYTLEKQPLLRYRFLAVVYELKTRDHISAYFGKHKTIFGPRYPDWRSDRQRLTDTEFMARQWIESERYIKEHLRKVSPDALHVRYEDLIQHPKQSIKTICDYIEVDCNPLLPYVHEVDTEPLEKWKNTLTQAELHNLNPLIEETRKMLGYD